MNQTQKKITLNLLEKPKTPNKNIVFEVVNLSTIKLLNFARSPFFA